ncbi:toll/interleukin-1 receptor domain-containing protein [Bradyrhizobium liaoningense]|uniref:toll/interleukin-1 receptor domain-containing protein n=1 Tax=Bradyrhizobium liaoningense TaxID=43992 RepID=UPI001BA5B942|nr:toll/interleukin-1 receptor domain-containing protein [Bradyrhizobium liaoningense]MBR0735410.1 toll/interleukin-1 receptor domain-containing protein [Bradyrhizobium liaoningense]
MHKVFISYRREDSSGHAGRLADRLMKEFDHPLGLGDRSVFRDVDGIPLGVDFVKQLTEEIESCDVLLALIGPRWIDIRDRADNRRLDNPLDFVRVEIRTALQRQIPVVPILLDGAAIPDADLLPEDIRPLAFRQSLVLRNDSFHADAVRLLREIDQIPIKLEEIPTKSLLRLWIFGALAGYIVPVLSTLLVDKLVWGMWWDTVALYYEPQEVASFIFMAMIALTVIIGSIVLAAFSFTMNKWLLAAVAFLGMSIGFIVRAALDPAYFGPLPGSLRLLLEHLLRPLPYAIFVNSIALAILFAVSAHRRWERRSKDGLAGSGRTESDLSE